MPINRNQCQSRIKTLLTNRVKQCSLRPHDGRWHTDYDHTWSDDDRRVIHPATCSLGPKHS